MSKLEAEKLPIIVCVDDEPDLLEVLGHQVKSWGFEPATFGTPSQALAFLQKSQARVALILSDFKMPEMTGLEFRKASLENFKNIPFIIVSGHISREDALKAVELKVSAFVSKPYNANELRDVILRESKERALAIKEEAELIRGFISDAETLLEELENLLLSLESNPGDSETINRIYAIAHTIKGSSGFFKPDIIFKFTHKFEDYLSPFKKNSIPIPPEAQTVLLKGLDVLKSLVSLLKDENSVFPRLEDLLVLFDQTASSSASGPKQDAQGKAQAPSKGGPSSAIAQKATEEVKVAISLLNEFMELSGEITVIRNMVNKLVRTIEKEFGARGQIIQLSELLDEMHKINNLMQEKIVDLRKITLKNVYRPLSRAVRDISLKLSKEIKLELVGDSIRVDNVIAEALTNSLIHIVRNCCDHGVETPDIRKKAGKTAEGRITITSKQVGETIEVVVSDDGKGIDPEILRVKAVEKGLYTPEAAKKMSHTELREMIFESGFSTASVVTDVSGRGVGMDMVKKSVQKIGGSVKIHSEVGKGSKFVLSLPIPKAVMIISSVLFQSGDDVFALPQDNVLRLINLDAEEFKTYAREAQQTQFLLLEETLVPILQLGSPLKTQPVKKIDSGFFIVVRSDRGQVAIKVDRIVDMEDTVVKKLSGVFSGVPYYLGATFLGDGNVALILKPDALVDYCLKDSQTQLAHQNVQANDTGTDGKSSESHKDVILLSAGCSANFAVELSQIYRLEDFKAGSLQKSGETAVILYRGEIAAVTSLRAILGEDPKFQIPEDPETSLPILMVRNDGKYQAIVVTEILDLIKTPLNVDPEISDRSAIAGTTIIAERVYSVLRFNGEGLDPAQTVAIDVKRSVEQKGAA